MKRILLFGAGKSATVLIRTLLETCAAYNWHLVVADLDIDAVMAKTGDSPYASALKISVEDPAARAEAISMAQLVISLLPPSLHILVARNCLQLGKNLLTASYASAELLAMSTDVLSANLLFLCEMGLDPGIDHMSAMEMIDRIRSEGGRITGFQSHCGGLVAPSSDDNPWHYKISWNPANIVSAGREGAVFLKDNAIVQLNYQEIFRQNWQFDFPGLQRWSVYPNRDSLKYRELYGLDGTETFVRTTIRHPRFIPGWAAIVAAGLTSESDVAEFSSSSEWSAPLHQFVTDENRELFQYLGVFGNLPQEFRGLTSARILQSLLEKNLAMKPGDKDMILMLHQVDFELDGKKYREESSFRLDGFDSSYTAMATTVGMPLAHAAELILKGELDLKGVRIPTSPEIYEKILPLLAEDGIGFKNSRVLM